MCLYSIVIVNSVLYKKLYIIIYLLNPQEKITHPIYLQYFHVYKTYMLTNYTLIIFLYSKLLHGPLKIVFRIYINVIM